MQHKKYFLDPAINLDSLSRKLGTNRSYLSQAIFGIGGCHFYTYINQLRIEEMMRRGDDVMMSKEALYEMAFQCGFDNRRTFNRVFFRETGMLPCDFLYLCQKQINE